MDICLSFIPNSSVKITNSLYEGLQVTYSELLENKLHRSHSFTPKQLQCIQKQLSTSLNLTLMQHSISFTTHFVNHLNNVLYIAFFL